MAHHGYGLHRFPPGSKERLERDRRLAEIKLARRNATKETIDGVRYRVVRLPDAFGFDIPFDDQPEETA